MFIIIICCAYAMIFYRDIRNVMAPGGRVYKQKNLTGQTVSSAQFADESNKCTPATETGNTNSSINQHIAISYFSGLKPKLKQLNLLVMSNFNHNILN